MQSQMMLSFHLAILSGSLVSAAVLQLPQTLNPGAQPSSNVSLTEWLQSNGSLSSYPASISHEEWNATLSAGSNEDKKIKLNCDGVRWDYDLDIKSCFSAYETMNRRAGPEKTIGSRMSGQRYDIELPTRYLSREYPQDPFTTTSEAETPKSGRHLCHRAFFNART